MNTNLTDLITMIGNLSRSMFSVQHLVSGFAYLLGILFFIRAFEKFKKIADKGRSEHMFVPTAYLLGGAALIYLPTMTQVAANTFFGVGNVLSYSKYNPYNIMSAMTVIVNTAGLIWFVRGCVLLVHASEPGVQHGPKGLGFLCAGVIAMHFQTTIAFISELFSRIISSTLTATPPS